jgi:hypothetical protein
MAEGCVDGGTPPPCLYNWKQRQACVIMEADSACAEHTNTCGALCGVLAAAGGAGAGAAHWLLGAALCHSAPSALTGKLNPCQHTQRWGLGSPKATDIAASVRIFRLALVCQGDKRLCLKPEIRPRHLVAFMTCIHLALFFMSQDAARAPVVCTAGLHPVQHAQEAQA